MVSVADFLTLPYTSDLTQAGLAYACKQYTLFGLSGESSPLTRFRRVIAEIGVELAFRRYLDNTKIPYRIDQTKPFTDPDRPALSIGGRRCIIITSLLSRKQQIRAIRNAPQSLLEYPALTPENFIHAFGLNDQDLLLFAFLNALVTPNRDSLYRAMNADQPVHQINFTPSPWSRPTTWRSLGTMTCQIETGENLIIELGGLSSNRNYVIKTLQFNSEMSVTFEGEFFSLHYLGTKGLPTGKIYLTSMDRKITYTILPGDWRNIWVYGLEIIIPGFITCGDYAHWSKPLPKDNRAILLPRPTSKCRSLPVSKLSPLIDLFSRARSWHH